MSSTKTIVPHTDGILAIVRHERSWGVAHVPSGYYRLFHDIRLECEAIDIAEWFYSLLSARVRKNFNAATWSSDVVAHVPRGVIERVHKRWLRRTK